MSGRGPQPEPTSCSLADGPCLCYPATLPPGGGGGGGGGEDAQWLTAIICYCKTSPLQLRSPFQLSLLGIRHGSSHLLADTYLWNAGDHANTGSAGARVAAKDKKRNLIPQTSPTWSHVFALIQTLVFCTHVRSLGIHTCTY